MTNPDVVSRFAPAPTGLLHLGHVVNALYVWGVTQAAGGRVLLRIEDHDRQRSRDAFERAIVEDLAWLGFVADEVCDRQSDRGGAYDAALARLRAQGGVYACDCSRRAIAEGGGTGAEGAEGDELRYPGLCREKGLAEGAGRGTRLRIASTIERFDDRCHGPQTQRPADQCGDLLLRDRDGNWTYQFAVTVDDMDQGVTLVIRGDDLLTSTGRQIQLARRLGRATPPRFLHHPLVMKSDTQKLSKADGDTSVRDLRAAGWSAEQVVGQAASLVGLIAKAEPMAATDARHLLPLVRLAGA